MRKTVFFLLALIISANVFAQNSDTGYIRTLDGSEYKIYKSANGIKFNTGNFMQMNVVAMYKDSILFSSQQDEMPQYGMYDTTNFPHPFKDAFQNVATGDSIIIRIPTDSLMAKGQLAPFMQPGQYIYQVYTLTNVYVTKEQVDSSQKVHAAIAQAKEDKKNAALLVEQNKAIETYLASNNLKAIQTSKGVYMVITKEGTGNPISVTDTAWINYTGRSFSTQTVFDSDTDPAFGHVESYPVYMSRPQVIAGWVDAIFQMKKGSKATVFIPSPLGYGSRGNGERIKPDEILIFDMEIAKVSATT
ncbi:MAG: FKBP-type peptidyl-prolyl cis-trans isomerase [Ferruginibacter sp.]